MANVGDNQPSGFIQGDLVYDEIRAIIEEAVKSGGTLFIASHVERLSKTYSTSGLSKGRIADELILAASDAKVPVYFKLSD